MERVLDVLNQMQADGVIEGYAIGGGIAAVYYLEPYETNDIDVFLSPVVTGPGGLVSLEPLFAYLKERGYLPAKEGVVIEDWLVQFVPAFASVQEEAVAQARLVAFGGTHTFIFGPEHLAVELLRSGRRKDHVRVIDLIESGHVDMVTFRALVERHGLAGNWTAFAAKFDLER